MFYRIFQTKLPYQLVSITVLLLILAATAQSPLSAQNEPTEVSDTNETALYSQVHGRTPGPICELPYIPSDSRHPEHGSIKIDPDELARMPQTATITVNYSGNWTAQAKTAFEYALSIWEKNITSSVPIVVNANWSNLGDGVLGAAGPDDYARNFSGAPQGNTWYPIALANALAGTDLSGGADIDASFNSTFDWYYGTDGNPPFSKVDFVSVVLHEVAHGLGFAGSFAADNTIAAWGAGTTSPDIYDRFVKNGGGAQLISAYPNYSSALRNQLTTNNAFFDGPQTRGAHGDPAPLYAPEIWAGGSSIAHLAQSFNGTSNSLMTYSIGNGVAEHDPGDVTRGILADMGWTVTDGSPTFYDGAVMLEHPDTINNAIDLWQQTTDGDSDAALSFEITNGSTSTTISGSNISATLDSDRYLDVAATNAGTLTIHLQVTDTDNNTSNATVTIYSVDTLYQTYLPVTQK